MAEAWSQIRQHILTVNPKKASGLHTTSALIGTGVKYNNPQYDYTAGLASVDLQLSGVCHAISCSFVGDTESLWIRKPSFQVYGITVQTGPIQQSPSPYILLPT
jgi:hypothetical protein